MQTDTRRIVVAMFAAMAVLIVYQIVVNEILPPPEPPPAPVMTDDSQPPATPASGPTASTPGGVTDSAPTTTRIAATAPDRTYSFTAASDVEPITLGGQEGDALRIELNSRGAALVTLQFYAKDKKGRFVQRIATDSEEPYELLSPVDDGRRAHYSFGTHRIWIEERNDQSWRLDDLPWFVVEKSPHKVVFTTTLGSEEPGDELLRLTKTYELHAGKPVFDLDLSIENAGPVPLTIRVEQDGPIGVRQEHLQYDMRNLLTTQHSEGSVVLNKAYQHGALKDATQKGQPVRLLVSEKGPFLWTALSNKYFATYTRPLPVSGEFQDYVTSVSGLVAVPSAVKNPGDLRARIMTKRTLLQPHANVAYVFEVYAGPKDAENLRRVDPAFTDTTSLYYQVAQSADRRCFCTFLWLQDLMIWLLDKIHFVVRNYGVAIIILVIIIRGLLHPLTVWQQRSMFRMQESMAKIQPKMQAIKEKYANDKVKQNQETMKLFGEEGVNPAASFVSFLPLLLQMPILVALWTALNTDIHLRHAPFDGWWIVDLSAPDAFIEFESPKTIPVLGQIPLLGRIFTDIASINLLPILMGVSMWLQQKYMPKPHLKAKLEAAKQGQAEPKKPRSGMSPEDQIRQQQMMAYMMSILFPLMFYLMPSGLNLYWLSTNVFGIGESLLIRRQIDQEKQRRERQGPGPTTRRPGLVSRFFKHIAAQAEELQHKADEVSKAEAGKKKGKKKP